jgi:large subunit ribosomal protein L25
MESLTLAFQDRPDLKKANARRLRNSGRIPAVVYGQGQSVPISVEETDFSLNFKHFGENTIIKLQNGKKIFQVLVRDYQDDLLTGRFQHIDFYEVSTTKTLHTKVPLHLEGIPAGVRAGGLLEHLIHEIEVECLPQNLPHEVKVDVLALEIGQSVHVSQLPEFSGVRYLASADAVVAHVINTKNLNVEPVAPVTEAVAADSTAPASSTAGAPGEKKA